MVKRSPYFVTTPIYYVNDKPHIGHYYCTLMTDVLARWHRLQGDEVLFSTGTDENSQKILPVARAQGLEPKEFVSRMSQRWQDTWTTLGMTFDRFVRTTSPEHHRAVGAMFDRWLANGDVYKKKYQGLYCIGCEKFIKESELVDGLCPDHKTAPQSIEEENYFFRLSKYQDRLLELLSRPDFALPESRRNEMLQFVKQGLDDLSLSRSSLDWGIPLPTDPTHVFYVWFDALINYLTVLGYGSGDTALVDKFWPVAIHLVGKEIFRFHAVIWPAMLMSAGLPLPQKVFGHGWFTVNGEKISKSLGNAIDPLSLTEKYGNDTLRFYTLVDTVFGKDSDFSTLRLEEAHNSYLANDYGNLVSRVLNMIEKYSASSLVKPAGPSRFGAIIGSLQSLCFGAPDQFDSLKFEELIRSVFGVIGQANKLIDDLKPWDLAKKGETAVLEDLLYTLFETLRLTTFILHPVMPWKTAEVYDQMGFEQGFKDIDFDSWLSFGITPSGHRIRRAGPVFPRREIIKQEKVMESAPVSTPASAAPNAAPAPNATGTNVITIDDFKKVELVTAKVLEAGRVTGADKLLKLRVTTGDSERTILAGVAQYYEPDQLLGKTIVIVKNLAPRKLRGEISEGMLLAAKSGDTLSVLTVEKDLPPGSPVS
jgi:methionyl-tRNA synthetase